ncbi:MAG: PQQ-dependent sugar dehydrogenase [Bryobacteraceae bacterium]
MHRSCCLLILAGWATCAADEIRFVPIAVNVPAPVDIQSPGDGSKRLYFVSQSGKIYQYSIPAALLQPTPILDISSKTLGLNECGLLGLAFPPGFASKRYFYVNYTDTTCANTIVARYSWPVNSYGADPASEQVILRVAQPFQNHNGGQLRFGPDGYLYIGLGDGGSGGDPQGNAQNKQALLGKILRIDTESGATPYAVPPTNPFVGNAAYRPEIWALGVRNPWRFSFDRQTGDMWIGDVGQDRAEEVDFQPAGAGGLNYGWNVREGLSCYPPSVSSCNSAGFTAPVLEHTHADGDRSVTGGFVYRGSRYPALVGTYVYGDYITGRYWGISRNGSAFTERLLSNPSISVSAFAEDEDGELYMAGYLTSTIYRIEGAPPSGVPSIVAPTPNLTIGVAGVTFQWSAVAAAAGYDLRILRSAATVFQGNVLGTNATSTLVSLPDGAYTFQVRACAGGFDDAHCGGFASVNFAVAQAKPSLRPTITAPAAGQEFTTSTQTFSWTSVSGAGSYEIQLADVAAGGAQELAMAVGGSPPPTSTVFSMRGSANYRLQVRACTVACGDWSDPVTFKATLPAVPTAAPGAPGCSLGGAVASCSWNTVANADFYTLQAVQPASGPGGGALTVTGLRTTQTNGSVTLPPGAVSMFVAGCNGNGCGPYSSPTPLNPGGANPAVPQIGNPVGGSTVDGPDVFFSWNRVAGDNGSNTVYRLYVQDFSRQAPALDVLTTSNFWAAKFRAGGSRYDALVQANIGTANVVSGPPAPFLVRGTSIASPTMVQPRHQSQEVTLTVAAGNVQLGWTPVPGTTLYEYLVAEQGYWIHTARGVTPGLLVQVPLPANSTFLTGVYSGIVRACPAGQTCTFGSDAGWGPWSSAAGQGGVTNFRVQ